MTKKKKLFLVVVVLMFILVIDNLGQLSYLKLDEEQRINNTLEKEVLKLKSENSFWGNISKKVNEVVGKVLDEE